MPVGPGRLERDHCTTIDDSLTLKVGGNVELTAWVPKNKTPGDLRLSMFVPAGSDVRLRSTDFVLDSPDLPGPQALRAVAIAPLGKSADLPATTEMRGERHVNYTAWGSISSVVEGSHFRIKLDKAQLAAGTGTAARSFSVRFPELTIDGQTRQIPPLLFEAYSKVGLAGFCN